MKLFFTFIWTIICLTILIVGHTYWHEKTDVKVKVATPPTAPVASESKKAAPISQKAPEPNNDAILIHARNWPEAARGQFEQSLKQNQPFKILFVGSQALGNQDQGMLKDVVAQLTTAFGNHVTVAIHTYNVTSKQFVANNDQQAIAAEKAQMIVLEPFILNDNGNVAITDSLNNLTKIIGDVQAESPNTTFILQPSFPLYAAKYYPGQVAKLKEYADQHMITYLDHWTAWPDYTTKELNNYLLPNASAPNDKGNQVWGKYLVDYLVHQ